MFEFRILVLRDIVSFSAALGRDYVDSYFIGPALHLHPQLISQ
jgi:hypothetical protein